MSLRIEKINELLRHELGSMIVKEIELPQNSLITITKVETTPDIKATKIYITCLPENMGGTVLKILAQQSHNLKKILYKRLKTKFVPNLHFVIDEQELFATKVDKILDEIKDK